MSLPSDDDLLRKSYEQVRAAYYDMGGTDNVSKGSDLVTKVKEISI
jgi:hypothetical protein